MTLVDLRSDTVTQPTAAMRAAMMAAPLGDDVFGDRSRASTRCRKRSPPCWASRRRCSCPPARRATCAPSSRIASAATNTSSASRRIATAGKAAAPRCSAACSRSRWSTRPTARLPLADIEAAIKPDDAHFARTRAAGAGEHAGRQAAALRLRARRQRHWRRHGSAAPSGWRAPLQRRGRAGREDAAAAVRDEARRIAQCFDSVSVCFSKGLGAPVGSALCGSREFIARAHRIRKMAGGGMRQAGLLAAAASHALDHHVERLAEDHALARRLAEGLAGIEGLAVEPPHSNIIFVDLSGAAKPRIARVAGASEGAGHPGHRALSPALRHAPRCGCGRRRARRRCDPAASSSA